MSQQIQSDNEATSSDTTHTKIFVGGLPWATRTDGLTAYFSRFGEIVESIVICDRQTGRSKGYGFVTFRNAESAARACENQYPIIEGRQANCNLAHLGARSNNQVDQNGFGPERRAFVPHSHAHQQYDEYIAPYDQYYCSPYIPQHYLMGYYNAQVGTHQDFHYMNPYSYYGHNGFNQNGHAMPSPYVSPQGQAAFEYNLDHGAGTLRTSAPGPSTAAPAADENGEA